MVTYRTLITVIRGHLFEETIEHLKANRIRHNSYLTEVSLIKDQAYIHGNFEVAMYDIVCTNLNSITREILNRGFNLKKQNHEKENV